METEWKKVTQINGKYFIDPAKWICACPAYIRSRVFLCKHLVNSVEKADAMFFKKVRNNLFLILFVFYLRLIKVQRNGKISSYEGKLVNVFYLDLENPINHRTPCISLIQDSIAENEDSYMIESDDEAYETDLAYLYGVLDKVISKVYI